MDELDFKPEDFQVVRRGTKWGGNLGGGSFVTINGSSINISRELTELIKAQASEQRAEAPAVIFLVHPTLPLIQIRASDNSDPESYLLQENAGGSGPNYKVSAIAPGRTSV